VGFADRQHTVKHECQSRRVCGSHHIFRQVSGLQMSRQSNVVLSRLQSTHAGRHFFNSLKRMADCVHPCPRGWLNDPQKACGCASAVVTKYQKRISGPLLDRIDIHIEVPRVDYEKLSGDRAGETSASIRARVQAARDIQTRRFSNIESSDIACNADMRVGRSASFAKWGMMGSG